MVYPKEIKLINNKSELEITWDNDTVHRFPLRFLRDESPDASNKGETILWKHYEAAPKGPDMPGKYEIASIDEVGSYAINIHWKDGNSYGIYSYELLFRWGEYLEVKRNLHQDFEHGHSHEGHTHGGHTHGGHTHGSRKHEGHKHEGHKHEGHDKEDHGSGPDKKAADDPDNKTSNGE